MSPCFRCHQLTTVKPTTTAMVLLCAACAVAAPDVCARDSHQWRGTTFLGVWCCLICLTTMGSQAITASPTDTRK
jgi:hypothetical protein